NAVAGAGRADRAQPDLRTRWLNASDRADGRCGDHRENARFFASPIPVMVHIVSVTAYSLIGALQFVPSLRRGRPSWHRIAGRILVPAGLLVALSGLWMNFFYARPPGDGESLVVVRLIVGLLMLASIVLAVMAIQRRDFAGHGAWMTRGYAIALGA